ncbi:MAG: TonB-dependent receptor [Ignavibacteria bacterium]|nr:MAG: TonB-dependent receptor [Ignavibacteria bacterium]
MQKLYYFFLIILFANITFAQETTIKGKVTGSDAYGSEPAPLVGVNILVKNTTTGTSTDLNGEFSLNVDNLPVDLVFSYIGYEKKTITVSSGDFLDVVLAVDIYSSEDVLIVGSRFRPRTSITSPVPIDNIKLKDLQSTSQTTFDKMLSYTVPSFNSTQQTISDATAHFDPADLRGLGPSRTLVLINGKRKNPSALVYINDTPGKGDVGVDMNSIPINAIKRVEVLRDGASAQYGSDAIAGVINIVLNDQTEKTDIGAYSGITEQGDGFQIGATVNTGLEIGDNGFLNVSTGYSNQNETNRAGSPGSDVLFGQDASNPWIQKNPSLGMRVGLPNMKTANVYYNGEINIEDVGQVYSFGGLVFREGLSYALYRTPYWIPDPFFIKHKEGTEYQGFQPTFETSIFDAQWTTGFRSQTNGWKYDLSYTFGKNSVDYKVDNSINLDLEELSPTVFDPGGYEFNNNIINFDISKLLFQKLFVSVGTEFRQENFITIAGSEASYFGGGAQSFPGLQPQNAVDAKRTNVGVYLDLGLDITENIFLGGATRFEEYSDFGENFTFKINGRVKTSDNRFSVRGSISSGFRAPSLHQIHLSNIQTLISAGTVSNQGTFNNDSPVLRQLGVDKLKEETSTNITLGFASRPIDGLFLSVDVFQIDLDDRIVYSSSIFTSDTTTTVYRILQANSITSLKFFINAVNTRTQGIDIVASYDWGKLRLNLAASFLKHSIEGKIKTPKVLEDDGIDIFDRKEQSRILTARPTEKVILGISYDFDPVIVGVSGIYFGSVKWQHVNNGLNGVDLGNGPLPTDDAAFDQVFSAKVLTDLFATLRITNEISFTVSVNNLFNVYPDVIDTKGDFVTDLGGRFKYPWEVNQFGFNGRVVLATVNFNL